MPRPEKKDPNTISLEAAETAPVSFDLELPLPLSRLDREPLLEISPARFSGEVRPIESGFSLDGHLAYGGQLECSRCLAPYPFREDEDFTLVLYPSRPAEGAERELGRDELDVFFYEDENLSVAPIVEERIQMAIPMKPLCREDCRGLCATCGADLNQGDCGCRVEAVDPRWEALQKIKKG